MRIMIERNFVRVIGSIWQPGFDRCTMEYPLRRYDVENIGEFTRENVSRWLDHNAGDFSRIDDFYATIGDAEIQWACSDSEIT